MVMTRSGLPPSGTWVSRLCPVALFALCALPAALAQAQDPEPEPEIGPYIEGTAAWDAELVRSYFRKFQEVDIGAGTPDYPGRAMLDDLNPEFGRRIDVLMAVYQAHGGNDIGIAPRTGGLRSAADQLALYQQCREIRTGANGRPVGDGSRASDYQEIPAARRTAANCPAGRPVTSVWVSWHNLGVAVDFGLYVNGRYNNGPLPQVSDPWLRMVQAAADLGMIWGGWFPWDPAHFEWHPKEDSASGVAGAVSGTALTDDQIDAGYDWKLPTKLFVWYSDPDPKEELLRVFDLNADSGWVVITKSRVIKGHGGDEWQGHWSTFDPPLRAFPIWIPAVKLVLNENAWPEDERLRSQCQMKQDMDFHTLWSDGTPSEQAVSQSGKLIYAPSVDVFDRQKEANVVVGQGGAGRQPYAWLVGNSIYTTRVSIEPVRAGDASMQTITTRGRDVGHDGYTTDDESELDGWMEPMVYMEFAWNRDTGEVGVDPMLVANIDPNASHALQSQVRFENGGGMAVAYHLPDGAWDCPEAPEWPAENKKPDDTPSHGSGFLRP